jgi:hypothetical protein
MAEQLFRALQFTVPSKVLRGAPGLQFRNVSTRNWGTENNGALREHISMQMKRITEGTVSITSRAHPSGMITMAAGAFIHPARMSVLPPWVSRAEMPRVVLPTNNW